MNQGRNEFDIFIEGCKPFIRCDGGYGIHISIIKSYSRKTGYSIKEIIHILAKALGCTYRIKKQNGMGKFLQLKQPKIKT